VDDLLAQIESPEDLKRLNIEQLEPLAEQIRRFILDSVSKTGGHLASNLGVVEVTLALHYTFDFKKDALLWDVGHQCYAHKIITGRKDLFGKLRQADGISGFPNPAESRYDRFMVGHAGTSIATAIGMALGQSQLGDDDKIVAFVGDASIVNGLSFEALNNLGLVKRQLLIVLNDNSMAIDSTQGAVAKYFSKIRLSQTYEDLRKTAAAILEHTPVIGKSVEEAIERIKKSIRMVLPASQLFESLNIPYFGPVDGHDIKTLVQLFGKLAGLDHPAVLHVYTRKGKGFTPAATSPGKFHSTGPFGVNGDQAEAAPPEAGRTFTQVFAEHIVELARTDNRIIAITSAMTEGTGLRQFHQEFPDRFYDVGIAESAAVDIAAGFAACGLRPVVCIYSTFLQRSFDQLFQEVALQNLPVVFCVDRAGLVGPDGPTHHGLLDVGFLRMLPNFVLVAPTDENEMRLALDFALAQKQPVAIRYPKDLVPSDDFDRSACTKPFELGRCIAVRDCGDSNMALVAYGPVLTEALEAAEMLESEGISVGVINARFAAPVDKQIVSLLDSGVDLVTVEDHGVACGFGSALAEAIAAMPAAAGRARIASIAMPREPVDHDSRRRQLIRCGVTADNIAAVARRLCKNRTMQTNKG